MENVFIYLLVFIICVLFLVIIWLIGKIKQLKIDTVDDKAVIHHLQGAIKSNNRIIRQLSRHRD